jgi:lysophospholipase L1-like esterase
MKRDSSVPLLEKFGQWLSPFWVFFGIVVGFALMVLAGRWAGKQNLFAAYKRSYVWISPEGYFYPSLNNLTQLVTHIAERKKILVLVGGDSVLVGVGQKTEQVWTEELQRLLGPDFQVVNLAFRGAGPMEVGAVVAEVLSKKYPRLIYVAREDGPMVMGPPDGFAYAYLFWQAQAAGTLVKFTPRSEDLEKVFSGRNAKLRELKIEAWLRGYFDHWIHASDLWNYIGYNYLFTVFNPLIYPPEHFFEARKKSDNEAYQYTNVPPIPERFMPLGEQSMQIIRSVFQNRVKRDLKGDFKITPAITDNFIRDARAAFPDEFKRRTFILLSCNAPYFVRQLSKDEHDAYQFIYSQGKSWLQKAGYHSILVGPDLTDEDFADCVHLTPSGGQKMASDVAQEIRAMAIQLGYVPKALAERYP